MFIFVLRDWYTRYIGWGTKYLYKEIDFAFLVHPRYLKDVREKFFIFRLIPKAVIYFFTRHFPPIFVSYVYTNFKKGDRTVRGAIIACPMLPDQMLKERSLASKRIIQCAQYAEKIGVRMIGLGALTSSMTRGGLDIIEHVSVGVTTGHAMTTYVVSLNTKSIAEKMGYDLTHSSIAIVGAAGSIGSNTARFLAQSGAENFLFIDTKYKTDLLYALRNEIEATYPKCRIKISNNIANVKDVRIIVTATNAHEEIVYSKYVSLGTIIVDDAQPTDIAADVMQRQDVLVLEAGVLDVPGVVVPINLGLHNTNDIFSCLAEVTCLVANGWSGHFSLGRLKAELLQHVQILYTKYHCKQAQFQNYLKVYTQQELEDFRKMYCDTNNIS